MEAGVGRGEESTVLRLSEDSRFAGQMHGNELHDLVLATYVGLDRHSR